MSPRPLQLADPDVCVDHAIEQVGKRIVLGAPLGIGKPNRLLNAFYRRALADPSIDLTIFTALSLEVPRPSSDIEARFLSPFVERHFGNYEELEYMRALRAGTLPRNVTVHEFYFRAGSMLDVGRAQRSYICTNYTFVARDLIERGVNVLAQLVAEKEVDGRSVLSLSSNTDVTLDLMPMLGALREQGKACVTIAQVHPDLPFMYHRAMVEPGFFDCILRDPGYRSTLFAPPNMSVSDEDFAIGFHASTLLRDGGTLQIGIGALGDALVYGTLLRHEKNDVYRRIAAGLHADEKQVDAIGGLTPFSLGLYGCSEMLVAGFVHLARAGVLTREVFDDIPLQRLLNRGELNPTVDTSTLRTLQEAGVISARLTAADVDYLRRRGVLKPEVAFQDGFLVVGEQRIRADLNDRESYERITREALGDHLRGGVRIHAAFFLGPADFYRSLREMSRAEAEKIAMDSVRCINRMSDPPLQVLQRRNARFVNTAMMVTLGGAVVSDGLDNGQVVSGVGGQYNFVAQAHELPGARSIICLRATRGSGSDATSNIVFSYGHETIPRHLRDIVVTEYGVADLRARSDEEIIRALLAIADSRFQDDLLRQAKRAGKISSDYEIPDSQRDNRPGRIRGEIERWRGEGHFPPFPLGTDFTEEEIALGKSLREIRELMDEPAALIRSMIRAFLHDADEERARPYLQRIGLEHPHTPRDIILQHLLLLELEEQGYLRVL